MNDDMPKVRDWNKYDDLFTSTLEKDERDRARDILRVGANLAARGPEGRGHLFLALEKGAVKIAQMLIDLGADIKARDDRGNGLYLAARRGGAEAIQLLYKNDAGALLEIRNCDGETALFQAVYKDEGVKSLLAIGANARVINKKRQTLMHVAAAQFSDEAVVPLARAGCRLNAYDKDGNAPIHILTGWRGHRTQGCVDCLKRLLALGADPCKPTRDDKRLPLDMLVEQGQHQPRFRDMADPLVSAVARVKAREEAGG